MKKPIEEEERKKRKILNIRGKQKTRLRANRMPAVGMICRSES